MTATRVDALVIGGGPAGLMAAQELGQRGGSVVVTEAKPTLARKFLMAGRSGLNITKNEPLEVFKAAYDTDCLAPMLDAFGPQEAARWCRDLGQEVFTGSSGRVFPTTMKASPLLRAWAARLGDMHVDMRTRWRWMGWQGDDFVFETPNGLEKLRPRVAVLALGGASWHRLGSDGAWAALLAARGVECAPFLPANVGFCVNWSAHMAAHFGQAIKGCALYAGGRSTRGEFVLSARGLEGGGIYTLSRILRGGAALSLDFMPDIDAQRLAQKLAHVPPRESISNRLRKLGLGAAQRALLLEFGRTLPLETALKALPIKLEGPRPLDEAISVAGGVRAAALTQNLELRAVPGTFVCGEMLDWEAPTGGYLLTGCLATGRWAGRAAALACQTP